MGQVEKQKEVFLSVCGQHDYDLLTGKEAMTQTDFERITYITMVLGYTTYTQELISEHLDLACNEAERTDRKLIFFKTIQPIMMMKTSMNREINGWQTSSVKYRQQSRTIFASSLKKIQRLSDTQGYRNHGIYAGCDSLFSSC